MRTQIKANCIDQQLKLKGNPLIASGGVNENVITFEFCSLWDGLTKTAVFWREEWFEETEAEKKRNPIPILLDENNSCVVPWEVTADAGAFFFGVLGVLGEVERTSNVLKYDVSQGVVRGEYSMPEATKDAYAQIVAMAEEIAKNAHSHGNKTVLDEFDEDENGVLVYKGEKVGGGLSSVLTFPETANEGDVVLLHRCNEISVDDSDSGVILDTDAIASLALPEGYEQRVWEITATDPKSSGFYAQIEVKRIDDYILTALNLFTETDGGRWYWKNGEFTTDSMYGGETELPPTYISLGNVADFTFIKTLFDIDYEETPDTDETIIFRTLPLHYMFLNGEWQLVSPNNDALQRAIEELQRNVVKYVPMARVETTTTGTSIVEPNKMYNYGIVDTLTVVFDEGKANKVNEYLFSFISGETATVLTLPLTVKWVNELTVEPNKHYEVSVVDNVALWCAVDYEVTE